MTCLHIITRSQRRHAADRDAQHALQDREHDYLPATAAATRAGPLPPRDVHPRGAVGRQASTQEQVVRSALYGGRREHVSVSPSDRGGSVRTVPDTAQKRPEPLSDGLGEDGR